MPKYILYLFFMLLILPKSVSAAVKVDISNNGEGSSNDVSVNSDTSSNQQSSSTFDNHTDITIKSNGEVKEYHGSDGNIDITSGDGKSTVSVKNNGATNKPTQSSTSSVTTKTNITVNSSTDDSSASASPEASVAGIFKDNTESEQEAGFWAAFKRELESLFSLFKH